MSRTGKGVSFCTRCTGTSTQMMHSLDKVLVIEIICLTKHLLKYPRINYEEG
jgi:hypothetical protein